MEYNYIVKDKLYSRVYKFTVIKDIRVTSLKVVQNYIKFHINLFKNAANAHYFLELNFYNNFSIV